MSKLNVLYQSNEAFVIPLVVSLKSLFDNNKCIDDLNVYIIDDNIEEVSKREIVGLAKQYNRMIKFLNVDNVEEFLVENGVVMQQDNSYTTFYKIFATHLLKDIDKILYIDADTVVKGSLLELCDLDLSGYACGMVNSAICGVVKKYLHTKEHFNGGVIYYNLEYWRQNSVYNKFIKAITGDKSKYYNLIGDESLFNMVLKGKIKKLPLKYNFESTWWLWGWNTLLYRRLGWGNKNNAYYSLKEIENARKNPVIAHYINLTCGRPWEDFNDNPFRQEFEEYLSKINVWKKKELKNTGLFANNRFLLGIKYIIRKTMPFKIRSFIGFIQHERAWEKRIEETNKDLRKIDMNWEKFENYIKENNELNIINGDCNNCPLRKKCERAHHSERIQGIINTPPENTGHPFLIKCLKKFSFLLYLIPKKIFRMWSEYDNNTLGCPSHSIASNVYKIKDSYDLLTEKKSKDTYLSVFMYRLTFDFDYLNKIVSNHEEYFEIFNGLNKDSVVIDCGGFTGDTLETYLQNNDIPKEYLVFEPDKKNVDSLNKNIRRLGAEGFTTVYQAGVGDKEGKLYINLENGGASQLVKDSNNSLYSVDIVSIDSLKRDDISFIKMDIEGAELSALEGAKDTIKRCMPRLAICLYHKPTDLFDIPKYIKKICPDYNNFVVRHYYKYSFTETILYVWKS